MNKYLSKLSKVSESFTVYRYDNGFMIEATGRDSNQEWKTVKIMCPSEQELLTIIQEINSMEKDD